MQNVNFKTDIYPFVVGLVVFTIFYILFNAVENGIFWLIVVKLREATGRIDSFGVARDYQVAINPKILIYHFLFIIIKFGISSSIIASNSQKNIIKKLLIFAILIEAIQKITFYLRSPEEFLEFPVLIIAEIACAIAVCFIVGLLKEKWKQVNLAKIE